MWPETLTTSVSTSSISSIVYVDSNNLCQINIFIASKSITNFSNETDEILKDTNSYYLVSLASSKLDTIDLTH